MQEEQLLFQFATCSQTGRKFSDSKEMESYLTDLHKQSPRLMKAKFMQFSTETPADISHNGVVFLYLKDDTEVAQIHYHKMETK